MCVTFCVAERFVYHGTFLQTAGEGEHLKPGVQLLVIEYLGHWFLKNKMDLAVSKRLAVVSADLEYKKKILSWESTRHFHRMSYKSDGE